MKRSILLSLIAVLVLGVSSASAQSPAGDAYGGQAGVAGAVATSPPPAGQNTQGTLAATDNGSNGSAPSGDNGVLGAGASSPTAVANTPRALTGNSLPFTGFDVALLAFGGIALLGLGFGLRRVSRQPQLPV